MSSSEQGPPGSDAAGQNGPILVMPPRKPKRRAWDRWRSRLMLVVFVLFCLEIGIILTVAPWTPFWSNNSLLANYPQLRQFLMYDFVRGLISGLGVTDIWLAVAEAIRYRDDAD